LQVSLANKGSAQPSGCKADRECKCQHLVPVYF